MIELPRIEIEQIDESKSLLKVKKLDPPPRDVALSSEALQKKVIDGAKRIARGSLEYKEYIAYLKRNVDMNKCSFFQGLNRKEGKKISIELHHEPFYMFDLCQIVFNRQMEEEGKENVSELSVAEEVMRLHYQNKVGIIPISKTIHELVHNDKVFIPLQSVYGRYATFLDEYYPYIPKDTLSILQTKIDRSKNPEQDMSIIERHYIYVDIEGNKSLKEIEQ